MDKYDTAGVAGVLLPHASDKKNCVLYKKTKGNIDFLVVPNRNITSDDIQSGVFMSLAGELLFGKGDAFYYPKDFYTTGGDLTQPAPGLFDISPLNEYKDLVNIFFYNKTTSLDCDLANRGDGVAPTTCFAGVNNIRDICNKELGKKNRIDRIIVLDRVGWDFAGGVGDGSMWFSNYHTNQYYAGPSKGWLTVFEAGRVAAHEFGHTLGFAHVNVSPLQSNLFVIPPVQDAVSYSNSILNVPPNCDRFSSTKWCSGINTSSPCLKDFQIFLDDVRTKCGLDPTFECEQGIWNSDFAKLGHSPLSSTCNIGLNCGNYSGSYTNSCSRAFLTSSGDSVMGTDMFSFSPYESKLVRDALNLMNKKK